MQEMLCIMYNDNDRAEGECECTKEKYLAIQFKQEPTEPLETDEDINKASQAMILPKFTKYLSTYQSQLNLKISKNVFIKSIENDDLHLLKLRRMILENLSEDKNNDEYRLLNKRFEKDWRLLDEIKIDSIFG